MNPTELGRIIVRLIGDATSYTKMIFKVKLDTSKVFSGIQHQADKVTQAMKNVTASVAAPITAMGGISVKEFAEFDHAMTESQSIMNLTGDQAERMRDVAVDMAMKWSKSSTDMARSFYFLASAGFSAEQSIAALPAVERFAVAGAFDMSRATTYASDTLKAMGMDSQDAEKNLQGLIRVTDILVKGNMIANATTEQFAASMTRDAGSALRMVNKEMEEGVAVLAVFADQGIKAELAGNSLGRAIRLLTQSVHMAGDVHKQLGFNVYDAQGRMRNFADIIQNLEEILGPMSDELRGATLKAMGFQARMQQAILPLIGNSEKIRKYESELRNAGGTTIEVANKQMKSFINQLMRMKHTIEVAGIEIGEVFAPVLLGLVDVVNKATKIFVKMDPTLKSIIVTVLTATAGFILLGGAILLAGKVFNLMFGGVGILMGLIVTGAVAAGVGIATVTQGLGGIGETMKSIRGVAEATWDWLEPVRRAVGELATSFKNMFVDTEDRMHYLLMYAAEWAVDWLDTFLIANFGITSSSKNALDRIREYLRDAVFFAEFTLFNLKDVASLVWAGIKLGAVSAFNTIIKYIGKGFVHSFNFVGSAWKQVLQFMFDMTKSVFTKIFEVWKNPSKIKDMGSFASITDGIQLSLDGLKIKSMETLEEKLREEFDAQKDAIGKSFSSFRTDKLFKQSLADLAFAEDELMLELMGAFDEATPAVAGAAKGTGITLGDSLKSGMAKELKHLDAVLFGSAEALTRFADYKKALEGDSKSPKKQKIDFEAIRRAEGGGGPGENTKVLKDIRDILKKKGGAELDIEDADLDA